MARNRRERRPGKLDPHPLVKKLSDESGQPQNTIALHGYPGEAPADGEWLLWLSLAFTDSVQGRDEDIVHAETLPDDQGTVLYVKADAQLQYRRVQTQNVEASFLGGGIAAGAAAVPGATTGAGAALPPSLFGQCWPTVVVTRCLGTCGFTCFGTCPTHCATCFTCVTRCRTCELWCQRSIIGPCITQDSPICTVNPLICRGNPGGGFVSAGCPE
jgi:hypothetical protein